MIAVAETNGSFAFNLPRWNWLLRTYLDRPAARPWRDDYRH